MAQPHGQQAVEQGRGIAEDPRPSAFARSAKPLRYVDEGLEWATLAISMEPGEPMVLYNVACIFSLAGRLEEAIEHLEDSVRAGLRHKGWLVHDDNLDPLRDNPRFQALLEELE